MLRLVLSLFLCTNTVMGMIIPESKDCPANYREIMPQEFLHCAKLASEEKFNEAIAALKEKHIGKKYFKADEICNDLVKTFISSKEKYTLMKEELDPRFTVKDFIYEDLLRYFWWDHYYLVYEGLIKELYI